MKPLTFILFLLVGGYAQAQVYFVSSNVSDIQSFETVKNLKRDGGMTWLRLNYPESNILGKAVKDFKSGNIQYLPQGKSIINPKLDTIQSSDDIIEYDSQLKAFISKYVDSKRYTITKVRAKKLIIKSLNIESIKEMQLGTKYVYSGITADDVEVTVLVKKEKDVHYSKMIKDLAKIISNEMAVEGVNKILPLFDSISTKKSDSLLYKMTVASPNVYYKIKIVTFDPSNHNWDQYWKFFFGTNTEFQDKEESSSVSFYGPEEFSIQCDPLQTKNSTLAISPEFWKKGREDVKFRLVSKMVAGDLRLFIAYTTGNFYNNWVDLEVPFQVVDGIKYWIMDRRLIYTFEYNNITKLVYIQVRATQVDDKTISIKNHNSAVKLTYMQYPEVVCTYSY